MSKKLHPNAYKTQAGKGDRQRKVDRERFEKNWDRIFGKKRKKKACDDSSSSDSAESPSE